MASALDQALAIIHEAARRPRHRECRSHDTASATIDAPGTLSVINHRIYPGAKTEIVCRFDQADGAWLRVALTDEPAFSVLRRRETTGHMMLRVHLVATLDRAGQWHVGRLEFLE